MPNELIGTYSIGLSTMHRSANHEFYKVWLRLSNPEEPNVSTGFLKVSCFIVGPNERPPVHASEDLPDEEDFDSNQDMDEIQILEQNA